MKRFLNVAISIINIISFVLSMALLPFMLYAEIMGAGAAERLLKN